MDDTVQQLDRRSLLATVITLTGTTMFAGCLSEESDSNDSNSDDQGIDPATVNTSWLVGSEEIDDYDFTLFDPYGIDARDYAHREVIDEPEMDIIAGITRYLQWMLGIDLEDVEQVTTIDRSNRPQSGVDVAVVEGTLETDDILARMRSSSDDSAGIEIAEETTIGDHEVLISDDGEIFAFGADAVILSVRWAEETEPSIDFVERVIENEREEKAAYAETDDDINTLMSHLATAHIVQAGKDEILPAAPDNAVAQGRSISLQQGVVDISLVWVFETESRADNAPAIPVDQIADNPIVDSESETDGRALIVRARAQSNIDQEQP